MSVFSGRRDPSWAVPADRARRLEEIWGALAPAADPPPAAPPLGYRGCYARDPGGRRWDAFGGRVVLTAGGATEVRSDPDRQFEAAVLDSAPAESLPAAVRAAIRLR